MSNEQIIDTWFDMKTNRMDIITVLYDAEICKFIEANAPMRQYGDEKFYNVFGNWQKIKSK